MMVAAVSGGPFLFFFNDTATTEIYTLSLHDALPICPVAGRCGRGRPAHHGLRGQRRLHPDPHRSEEHTSELQSPCNLVCRLLLEKKKRCAQALAPVSLQIVLLLHNPLLTKPLERGAE